MAIGKNLTPANTLEEEKEADKMPSYSFQCLNCETKFEIFSKSFRKENTGDKVSDVPCESCSSADVMRIWPDEMNISVNISDFRDRQEKVDEYNKKKAKDPERADKNRRKFFGSDNVNAGKSSLAGKDHKIQRKFIPKESGTTADIDKDEFIRAAAKNPKAVKAAEEVLKKHGKSL